MANTRGPAPISTPISDVDRRGRLSGYVPTPWADYFNGLDVQFGQTPAVVQDVRLPSTGAAIGVTPISNVPLAAGLYRVSYYLVELQADNVGSSVTVTIAWTDRTTARSVSGVPLTANNINAAQTNTYLLRIDNVTPITYAVAYSSTGGAPKLLYSLDVALEQVGN